MKTNTIFDHILLRMKNVSNKSCRENQTAYFVIDKTPTHALFTQHYISLAC